MIHGPSPILVYGGTLLLSVFFAGFLAIVMGLAGRLRKSKNSAPQSALGLSPLDSLLAIQSQITEIEALPQGSEKIRCSVEQLGLFLAECQTVMPDLAGAFVAFRSNLNSAQADEGTPLLRLTELNARVGQ